MTIMICQTCYRTEDVLRALDKLRHVQGYAQCADCGGDLEYESVVVRQIHYDRQKEGIPLPEWLQEEREESFHRVNDRFDSLFRYLSGDNPSREIVDLPEESIAEKREKEKETEELKEDIQEARKDVKNPLENINIGDD